MPAFNDTPGKIEPDDTTLYEAYDRDFEEGERVFWMKLSGTVIKLKQKAAYGMPCGYDLFLVKIDEIKPEVARKLNVTGGVPGTVEAFRGHLRLMDSVVMHLLVQ